MDSGTEGEGTNPCADVALDFMEHGHEVAGIGFGLSDLGASMTNQFHVEILTEAQKRILPACAGPSKQWTAYLAGGSSLALQLGHRRSDDFDWFVPKAVAPEKLLADLRSLGRNVEVSQNTEGTFNGAVDGVKFSVFRYPYSLISPTLAVQGCNLASLPDLAAMKLAAVTQRSLKRDYVDVHAMMTLGKLSLETQVGFFHSKFPAADAALVVRGLGYLADVEKGAMPIMLNGTKWETVKGEIARALDRFDLSRALSGRARGPDLGR